MPSVFISYRHSDARTAAAWITQKLSKRYGADYVFEYQHHAEPSKDFRKVIGRAIRKCDVVLAIVGPRWDGGADSSGLKIQEANDWVRIELETAIQLDLPVIPILVEDAVMPRASDLPESLRDFPFLTALSIDATTFDRDVDALMAAIDKVAVASLGPVGEPTAQSMPKDVEIDKIVSVGPAVTENSESVPKTHDAIKRRLKVIHVLEAIAFVSLIVVAGNNSSKGATIVLAAIPLVVLLAGELYLKRKGPQS